MNIKNIIGKTPLIKINFLFNGEKRFNYFKAEWFNLTGSVKDRVAFEILSDAFKKGLLKENQEIVEVTSGNMGISLSAMAKIFKVKPVIFMPKSASVERRAILSSLNAKLIVVDDFKNAFSLAEKYAKENNAFLTRQFENKANLKAHQKTAKEVEKKLKFVPAFIAGMGTSGTLVGMGEYFKKKFQSKIFGLEPKSSAIFSGNRAGHHKIEGLADDFIPKLYQKDLVEKVFQIDDNDAIKMAQKLASELGLMVGISSGANFLGALQTNINGTVSVFADDNKKYLSTDLFNKEIDSNLVNQIKLLDFEVL